MGAATEIRRPKPFLFPEYCKGCGRCISACQHHAIALTDRIDPRTGLVPVEIDLEACNGCGLCFDACPEPYGLLPRPDDPADFELEDPAQLFGGRRHDAPAPVDRPDRRAALPPCEPLVVKGNYAAAIGALLAGCRHVVG